MNDSADTAPSERTPDQASTTAPSDFAPSDAATDDGSASHPQKSKAPRQPKYGFLGLVAGLVLVTDLLTKWWAESTLSALPRGERSIVLIEDVLAFHLAYNKGGAFGMFANENDVWRAPFFLVVSIGAVAFIVSLYRKLQPGQTALRWGLPFVLGGALGNLADRLTRGKVVDFIDYQATWVQWMNEFIVKINDGWHVTRHWPTFNVADMGICVGIGLMAIDMFLHKQPAREGSGEKSRARKPSEGSGPPPADGAKGAQTSAN